MNKQPKFRVSIITVVVCALIVVTGFSQVWLARNGRSVLEDLAKRSTEETLADLVYIGENDAPLAAVLTDAPSTKTVAKAAFVEVNKQRAAKGLAPFVWSEDLCQAAAVRAEEVSRKWSHTRPDGSDYYSVNSAIVFGENISKGFRNGQAAVATWMESESHRTNIMDPQYKTIAIYVYEAGNGNWYWVTEFGV